MTETHDDIDGEGRVDPDENALSLRTPEGVLKDVLVTEADRERTGVVVIVFDPSGVTEPLDVMLSEPVALADREPEGDADEEGV